MSLLIWPVESARLAIPESHPFIAHIRGLQATFDKEVKRAEIAEAQLEALRTELFEAQTTNAARQSLMQDQEMQVANLKERLVGLQSLLDGLQEHLGPTRTILDQLSRYGECGDKRQREMDGSDGNRGGEGSSKRLRR
jgi:chromosome segregation ATPase